MNSPLVIEQARHLARQTNGGDAAMMTQALYQRIYARSASNEELQFAEQFLKDAAELKDEKSGATLSPLEQLAQALLLANEFVFVD